MHVPDEDDATAAEVGNVDAPVKVRKGFEVIRIGMIEEELVCRSK